MAWSRGAARLAAAVVAQLFLAGCFSGPDCRTRSASQGEALLVPCSWFPGCTNPKRQRGWPSLTLRVSMETAS